MWLRFTPACFNSVLLWSHPLFIWVQIWLWVKAQGAAVPVADFECLMVQLPSAFCWIWRFELTSRFSHGWFKSLYIWHPPQTCSTLTRWVWKEWRCFKMKKKTKNCRSASCFLVSQCFNRCLYSWTCSVLLFMCYMSLWVINEGDASLKLIMRRKQRAKNRHKWARVGTLSRFTFKYINLHNYSHLLSLLHSNYEVIKSNKCKPILQWDTVC